MGTNYYRVPKSHEVVEKMQKLNMRIGEMDVWSASEAKNGFRTIPVTEYENMTPWDEFRRWFICPSRKEIQRVEILLELQRQCPLLQ